METYSMESFDLRLGSIKNVFLSFRDIGFIGLGCI